MVCVKNAFGHEIPQIKEILTDKAVAETIDEMLTGLLELLDVPANRAPSVATVCLDFAREVGTSEYEKTVHSFLKSEGVIQRLPEKVSERAKLIYTEVESYIIKGSLLDLGCGDGKVGELLSKNGCNVALADVYKNQNIDSTGLKFKLFNQGDSVPFADSEFDNVLASTVYHHSDDPVKSVKESRRVTREDGKILVIESPYGVHGEGLAQAQKQKLKRYLELTDEQQRRVNIFFDHFANRVIRYSPTNKINVPFNFNTPVGWRGIFKNYGLEQEKLIHLGWDRSMTPEYHTLHVLKAMK